MTGYEEWRPFSWHCPNCGSLVTGYKNADNEVKVECTKCHSVMIRKFKSRKHNAIDIYAPKQTVNK